MNHASPIQNLSAFNRADAGDMPAEAPPRMYPSLGKLCPEGVDLGGEYLLELDEACPVHAVVVAGVDIPKYVCLVPHVCPVCGHRETPGARDDAPLQPAGENPPCPACAGRGKRVRMRPDRNAAPLRTRKRMVLTDAQVREIYERLHPDGKKGAPRKVPGKGGRELLAFDFVRLTRVEEAPRAALQGETPQAAAAREQRLREIAKHAERIAQKGVDGDERKTRAQAILTLTKALFESPDEASDDDVDDADCAASGEVSGEGEAA